MSPGWPILITAEHGGNDVPAQHRTLFRGRRDLLASHRAWDPGTLDLSRRLAAELNAPLVASTTTRLLVDLNRSPHNPRVFSEITRGLPREARRRLLEQVHRPHWDAVEREIRERGRLGGTLLHLGVHSFTPVLDGVARRADVALLYDPARPRERELAAAWTKALAHLLPDRTIRRNYPYRGASDGLTTALRRLHAPDRYIGIEIEVNQRHLDRNRRFGAWVAEALVLTLPGRLS